MDRLCEKDHEVPVGMFVCPVCGSDDVADREGAARASGKRGRVVPRHEQAEQRLRGFINRGLLLLVLALAGGGLSIVFALDGSGTGYGFFGFVAWVLGFAGAAYLLCGIVGWGVKYGNEATLRD